jgi:hypothetical protein
MGTKYFCKNKRRREAVDKHAVLNGIDYLEVLDRKAPGNTPRQVNLLVRCLKPVPPPGDIEVKIEGGVRITPVTVEWFYPASSFSPNSADDAVPPNNLVTLEERQYFSGLPEPDHVLVVRAGSTGDFSYYTLSLTVDKTSSHPYAEFDPRLSVVTFSFKVECPSEFDCKSERECSLPAAAPPEINYLAKDYESFRRLMLDRLSVLMPRWQERNPADLQVALVELLAYEGDRLSYYQDAVAAEAYLDTARKRVSVRRHARLVDYFMHDGCNARTWVFIQVKAGGNADGATLTAETALLTPCSSENIVITPAEAAKITAAEKPEVFETMSDVKLYYVHNRIEFYTWSDRECCLPRGAVTATLKNTPNLSLEKGDFLLFEEVKSPVNGESRDRDPDRRHVVRLVHVQTGTDPLDGTPVLDIRWHKEDALPFPFCVSISIEKEGSISTVESISIARGNIVLADHGGTTFETFTPAQIKIQELKPLYLSGGPVTCLDPLKGNESAASAMKRKLSRCRPVVTLYEDPGGGNVEWKARRDLLNSDKFFTEFVVETESDGTAYLRFGDGIMGKEPDTESELKAVYRVGNGTRGNIGAGVISHLIQPQGSGITEITGISNPLPAEGGTDPESIEEVRQFAPRAFRTQERAVTQQDYADKAMDYEGVQKAVATFRWTGSWTTVFLVIDREEGKTVEDDELFKKGLYAYMEKYRTAGFDLEIADPVMVPLDIAVEVCVKPGYFKSDIKETLLKVFSSYDWAPDQRGFFHPDNFTFARAVYLSRIYEVAVKVDGVAFVEVTRFKRWGRKSGREMEDGYLKPGPVEIVRLDNDPNFPENGKIEFEMKGGL